MNKYFLNFLVSLFGFYILKIFNIYIFCFVVFFRLFISLNTFILKLTNLPNFNQIKNLNNKYSESYNNYYKKNKQFFSLIVPAKDERDNIIRLIKVLENIDYSNQYYEVIIINDNSSDDTLNILNNYPLNNNFKIIDRNRKDGFVSGVLNDGLSYISNKTDIIGIIDSDCLVSKNILKILNYNMDDKCSGIQCQEWHYNNSDSILTKMQHICCIYENFHNLYDTRFKVGHFYKKNVINDIKYNEKSILEDYEFSMEMKKKKLTIKSINDVLVYRKFPNNYFKLYSQQYRYQLGLLMYLNQNNIFNSEIIVSQIIFLSLISLDINIIFKINILILIIIYLIIEYSFKKYYTISESNSRTSYPKIIESILNSSKYIYGYKDLFYASIFGYFILFLRFIPYFRLVCKTERIVWNR